MTASSTASPRCKALAAALLVLFPCLPGFPCRGPAANGRNVTPGDVDVRGELPEEDGEECFYARALSGKPGVIAASDQNASSAAEKKDDEERTGSIFAIAKHAFFRLQKQLQHRKKST